MFAKNLLGKFADAARRAVQKTTRAAQNPPSFAEKKRLGKDDATNREPEQDGFFARVAEAAEKLNPFDDGLSDEDRAFLELLDLDALDDKDDEPDDEKFGFFNVAKFFKPRPQNDYELLADPDYEAKKAAAAVPRRANLFRISDFFIFDSFLTKKKKIYLYKSIRRVVLRSRVMTPPQPLPFRLLNSCLEYDWHIWLYGVKNQAAKRFIRFNFMSSALLPNEVPHYQIWIETKNEDGETLLMSCEDKFISNMTVKKFLTAVEKSGARPEIWRTTWFTGRLRQLRPRKISRVRFTLRFSQKIGIFLSIYFLIAAILGLCLG